jgi:hypothetical protein
MTKVPNISEEQRTPLVTTLLEIIHLQHDEIQKLKDEIAKLQGQKPKPTIKASTMDRRTDSDEDGTTHSAKRPGSEKRRKTQTLEIHETTVITPDTIPEGSRFKGYQDYTVQDIIIRTHNTRYRLERWKTPQGDYVMGKLPGEVVDGHFGITLVSYILYQYYHAYVTQPLLVEQLHEFGIDISAGQVNRIIIEHKDFFHAEKEQILRVGLEVSGHINVDDTGARHRGKNGFCTHIGNELFAWFQSTNRKSRINFLELLRSGNTEYVINHDALDYMESQGLPKGPLTQLKAHQSRCFDNEAQWTACLIVLNITTERHVRIATEGALLGSVLEHGFNRDLVIISDDAGQFNVLLHALCWIHAERSVNSLVGFNDGQRKAIEDTRSKIWDLYADLKRYKQAANDKKKAHIEARFDTIFSAKTCFETLNKTLKGLRNNKAELLFVLERPDIPLHNNESERDIREYVKRRKISGSTRSDLGRICRDTFTSLKKTCRKHGISFWEYLKDRVSGIHVIPPLPDLIRLRALTSTG